MRRVLISFLLVLATQISHASVSEETDRFTGKVTYTTTLIPRAGMLSPTASIFVSGGKISSVAVLLMGLFQQWKYLNCNETHWLLDGKAVDFPQPKHQGSVAAAGVIDGVIYPSFGLENLKAIASANVVEFKICNDEYKFTEDEIADFRELAKKVEPFAKSPP